MTTIGPFRLIDPPPGQEAVVRAAVEAIAYPWHRLATALHADPDGCVLVKWLDTGQNVSGLFYGSTYEIHLSTRTTYLGDGAAFVFAHEVGHLVDRATFDTATRDAFTALLHRGPYLQMGHFNHDHPDAGHVSEVWADRSNSYVSMLNECYADQFVAAFAPSIWDGTVLPDARRRHPRFTHWTDDHAEVRRLTLARDLTPDVTAKVERETPMPPHRHPVLVGRIQRLQRTVRRLRRRVRRLRKK